MAEKEYIEREAFLEQKREQYCKDCARRKGMRNGKYKILYEIGEAPCRACEIDDALNDVEDFPAADVVPVVRCVECRYAPIGIDDGEEQGFGLEWSHDGWPGNNPCPFKCEDGWYSRKPKPDFFCANGEKREES